MSPLAPLWNSHKGWRVIINHTRVDAVQLWVWGTGSAPEATPHCMSTCPCFYQRPAACFRMMTDLWYAIHAWALMLLDLKKKSAWCISHVQGTKLTVGLGPFSCRAAAPHTAWKIHQKWVYHPLCSSLYFICNLLPLEPSPTFYFCPLTRAICACRLLIAVQGCSKSLIQADTF